MHQNQEFERTLRETSESQHTYLIDPMIMKPAETSRPSRQDISEPAYDTRRVCSTLYRPLDPSPRYLVGSSHAGSLFATDNSVSVAGSRTKGYISKPLLNFPAFCTGSIIDFPRVSQRLEPPSVYYHFRLLSSPLSVSFSLFIHFTHRRSFFVALVMKTKTAGARG